MSRPVGSASPNPIEVNFSEAESEPITSPAKKPHPASSQVEAWAPHKGLSFDGPVFAEAVNHGRELEAQMRRETADRKALGVLQEPLSKLSARFPDPIAFFGNTKFKLKDVAFGAVGTALREPGLNGALARMPASEVRAVVQEQVKKAWPQCSAKDLEALNQYFMGQLTESLRERAAPRLQHLATTMLEDAAKSFDKSAADPKAVGELAQRLTARAGDASGRDLRAALGLEPDAASVTPEQLAGALKERAALLHQEAKKMEAHGRPTLFRALAEQDVGPLFKEAAGIREGSVLAAQIDAVKEEGEFEQDKIDAVKLASLVVAGGVTGGLLSLGTGLVVGTSVAMEAPGVLEAWHGIDAAKAGESAGTMKAGAGEEAQTRALIKTGEAALSTATAGLANHALHGVVGSLAEPAAKHMADGFVKAGAHMATEYAVAATFGAGAHALEETLSAKTGATGRNALERAREE